MSNADQKRYRRGYLYALAAAAAGGASPTIGKYLVPSGPLEVAALATIISGVVFLPYKGPKIPRKSDLPILLSIAVLGGAIGPVLYFSGLRETTAVNGSLLVNGELFFTVVMAVVVFHESLKRRQLVQGLLVVVGIVIVSTNLDLTGVRLVQGLSGNVLIIAATFFFGLENNLDRIATQKNGAVFVAMFRGAVGGGILLAGILVLSVPLTLPLSSLPLLVLLGLLNAATTVLFFAALRRIGAVRTVLVFSTLSVFGSAYALVFLGEQLTPVQVAGGAFMLLGIYLIQRSDSRTPSGLPATSAKV